MRGRAGESQKGRRNAPVLADNAADKREDRAKLEAGPLNTHKEEEELILMKGWSCVLWY